MNKIEKFKAILDGKELPYEPYPVVVFMSRYSGTYEGADWIALNERAGDDEIADAMGDDISCSQFFYHYEQHAFVGRGDSPQEAYEDLRTKLEAHREFEWIERRVRRNPELLGD